jgi:quercetin dioxygenase-like cupin family protein
MRQTSRIAAVALGVIGLITIPATANATPSQGATVNFESQTTVGNTTYIVEQVTLAPGGTTGWHWNTSVGYSYIVQGAETHYNSACAVDAVNKAGQFITEPAGPDDVHLGLNLGTVPLIADFYYAVPAGSPVAISVPAPSCDAQ